jgi:hypothetical protein
MVTATPGVGRLVGVSYAIKRWAVDRGPPEPAPADVPLGTSPMRETRRRPGGIHQVCIFRGRSKAPTGEIAHTSAQSVGETAESERAAAGEGGLEFAP